ncbi:hypothetical protein J6U78_03790 [bacterium]|nr:hypothetical protein [bacterium]
MNDSMVPEQAPPQERAADLNSIASQVDELMGVVSDAVKKNPARRRADRPNDLMPGTYVGKVVDTRAYEGNSGPGFAILIEFVGFSSHYGSYTWRRFGRFEKAYSLVKKERVDELVGLYYTAGCRTKEGKEIYMCGDVLRCDPPVGLVVEVEVLDYEKDGKHRSFLGSVTIPERDPHVPSDDEIDRADFFTAKQLFPDAKPAPKAPPAQAGQGTAAAKEQEPKERTGYVNDPNAPEFPWG